VERVLRLQCKRRESEKERREKWADSADYEERAPSPRFSANPKKIGVFGSSPSAWLTRTKPLAAGFSFACHSFECPFARVMRTFTRFSSHLRVPQTRRSDLVRAHRSCDVISAEFLGCSSLLLAGGNTERRASLTSLQATQAVSQSRRLFNQFEARSSPFPEEGGGCFPRLNIHYPSSSAHLPSPTYSSALWHCHTFDCRYSNDFEDNSAS
jgi:hypothetical protein